MCTYELFETEFYLTDDEPFKKTQECFLQLPGHHMLQHELVHYDGKASTGTSYPFLHINPKT